MHQKCSVDQPLGTRHGPGLGPMRPLPRSKHAHPPAAGRHQGAVLIAYVVLPSRVPRCLATRASAERAISIRNQPTTTSTGSPRRPPSPRSPPRRRSRPPRPTTRRKWRSSRQRPIRTASITTAPSFFRSVPDLDDVDGVARRPRRRQCKFAGALAPARPRRDPAGVGRRLVPPDDSRLLRRGPGGAERVRRKS